jgi:hypothetical protein
MCRDAGLLGIPTIHSFGGGNGAGLELLLLERFSVDDGESKLVLTIYSAPHITQITSSNLGFKIDLAISIHLPRIMIRLRDAV